MRLLFVINTLGPGGAQRQMTTLACALRARGHEVELFVYHPELRHFSPLLEAAGVPIHAYAKRHRLSAGLLLALRRRIRSGGYDGVLAFLTRPVLYAELARLGLRTGFLVVSERNVIPARGFFARLGSSRQLHRLADHVTVNAQHQEIALSRAFPWLSGRITRIPNGVDLAVFGAEPPPPPDARGRIRLLALGSVIARKRPVELIRALAAYRARHGKLPIAVSWAGRRDYTRAGQQTFDDAETLLEGERLREHWSWLGKRSDVPALLRGHDALVHLGGQEGLPNAICEALSCGRPVLASRVLDHPLLVEEGKSGFLFDPLDPGELVEALHRLVSLAPDARAQMGQRARKHAERNLSLAAFADAYEALFLRLLAG